MGDPAMDEQAARRMRFFELLEGKRAVLFDFDGVIVDSEYYHYVSYAQVFERLHGHIINQEEYWRHWTSRGEGIPGEVRRHGLKGVDPAVIREEKDRIFYGYCCSGSIRFFNGALDLMTALEARGLKTAIASNSNQEWIEAIFKSNGITYRPSYIIGKKPELLAKPAPDIFVAAARKVDEAAEACLVFEDAEKGLEAAHAAGMKCVIIRNALNRGIDFNKADLIVSSHKELLGFFSGEPVAG